MEEVHVVTLVAVSWSGAILEEVAGGWQTPAGPGCKSVWDSGQVTLSTTAEYLKPFLEGIELLGGTVHHRHGNTSGAPPA